MRPIHKVPAYGSKAWLEARFRIVADDPWGHSWKAYESKRYTFVLEVIRKWLQGESLELLADSYLDIGCSTGHFSKKLRDLFQRVVAVDISHTAVERAKLNYPGINFHCGTLPPLRHVCHRGIIGIDSRRSHLVAWSTNPVVYQTRYGDLLVPFRDNPWSEAARREQYYKTGRGRDEFDTLS